ncbi:hypothetical protein DFH09DRAFT_1342353 [Mycena vulgaris]|nr:hypothetical protein DFH09DRAFT_1342353 [Mycena vulgaris]
MSSVKIKPVPILNTEHCTIFPYVQTIEIDGSMEDGIAPMRWRDWMDDFLRLIPKFVSLRSLELYYLDARDCQGIQRSMPQSIKNNIKEVSIDLSPYNMSEFAAFVSMFTALESLSYVRGYPWHGVSESTQGLASPPPLSVRELLFGSSDQDDPVAPTVLNCLSFQATRVQFNFSAHAASPQLKSIQLDFWQQTFSYSYFDKAFLSTIEWLPKILALLPPSIEEIILFVELLPVSPQRERCSRAQARYH